MMRALVWLVEDTWASTVDQAAELLPADAEVTLLHVVDERATEVVGAVQRGRLGRRARPEAAAPAVDAIGRSAADALLRDASHRLGGAPALVVGRGRVEREVVAAASGMSVLLLSRDGDLARVGPRSLGPAARFVVDHAPCATLLLWPRSSPDAGESPSPAAARPRA